MSFPYRLPKNYKIPEDVAPRVNIQDIQLSPGLIEQFRNAATEASRKTIVNAVAQACIEVGVDPDIVQNSRQN